MRATFFLLPNCNGKQILSGHLLLTWTEPRGEVKSFKRAPIVGGTVIAVYLWLQIAVPQWVVPLGRNGCMRPLLAAILCCKLRTCSASATDCRCLFNALKASLATNQPHDCRSRWYLSSIAWGLRSTLTWLSSLRTGTVLITFPSPLSILGEANLPYQDGLLTATIALSTAAIYWLLEMV